MSVKTVFAQFPKLTHLFLHLKLKKKLLEIEEINKFIIFKRNLFSHKENHLKFIKKI